MNEIQSPPPEASTPHPAPITPPAKVDAPSVQSIGDYPLATRIAVSTGNVLILLLIVAVALFASDFLFGGVFGSY